MAFIAFNEIGSAAAVRHIAQPAVRPIAEVEVQTDRGRLSPLEWSVVAVARRDRMSSLRRPGRLSTALRAVFVQPNPMLADERLEALRRVAVLTWHHGYAIPPAEVRRFIAAGFTTAQYEAMADSIGAAKTRKTQG
ncbi:hypothetical protein GGQ80_002269 [Sphingomonas jinjuensis]|uniref:Uncharacterized protein n=1 Tax=Sphingomonas jinjuensis TaxID=535907 RepID=A0A840FDP3_9SPHN|nr:hypothetical protein [Sphingomonas jinjuensis]MBB4154356.1 hypothetical protein [Sphingomonas jinjuensis]